MKVMLSEDSCSPIASENFARENLHAPRGRSDGAAAG
jgi:hypothetical protein